MRWIQKVHFKRSSLLRFVLPVTIILAASFYMFWPYYQTWRLREAGKSNNSSILHNAVGNTQSLIRGDFGQPIEITMARLDIDLPVIPGYFDNKSQSWSLANGQVYWANITSSPGALSGTSILYGHANKSALISTRAIAPNELLIITTKDGYKLYFRYTGETVVNPSDTDIFKVQNGPDLVLITCQEPYFTKRRLMNFSLVKVDKLSFSSEEPRL